MIKTLNKIDRLYSDFVSESKKSIEGNKSASKRARLLSLELRDILKDFRRISLKM